VGYLLRVALDSGIPLVTIEGFAKRQFQIQISQANLRQYGVSPQDIATIIGRQNIDLPAGEINTASRDYQIRFNDEPK
jgi:multidrug efflux pump subunit AcrB